MIFSTKVPGFLLSQQPCGNADEVVVTSLL
jgi:hypothetical protein